MSVRSGPRALIEWYPSDWVQIVTIRGIQIDSLCDTSVSLSILLFRAFMQWKLKAIFDIQVNLILIFTICNFIDLVNFIVFVNEVIDNTDLSTPELEHTILLEYWLSLMLRRLLLLQLLLLQLVSIEPTVLRWESAVVCCQVVCVRLLLWQFPAQAWYTTMHPDWSSAFRV